MLREGLAAEFPSASRALASLPRRLVVSREDPRWAAISAFGAAGMVGAAGRALATLPRAAGLGDAASWLAGGFAIVAAALGFAVAIRDGGRRGLLWYAIVLVANALLVLAINLPGYLEACARIPQFDCSPLGLALPHLYTLAGLALSVIAARFVTAGGTGANPVSAGAGAWVLSSPVFVALWRLTSVPPSDPIAAVALGLGFVTAGMLAAGVVIRLRGGTSARPLTAFAIIATFLWIGGQWPFMWAMVRGVYQVRNAVDLYPVFIGPVQIVALLVGWILPLPGAHDRGRLMQVRGGVEPDEEDPAPRG